MFNFYEANKKFTVILIIISIFIFISVVIGYAPITEKGKHYWGNIVADTKGKKRKIIIYNCNTNNIINTYEDSAVRFEALDNGMGIRIWLGEKEKKVSTNMCWLIEDKE